MRPYWWYHLWTTGTYTVSHTIPLDWRRRYLVTGHLTLKQGDAYAHVYIGTVCRYRGGDQILCGVRDIPDDRDLGVVEFLDSANRVTVKLRTTGGRHRAEGMVYEL